MQLKNFIKGIVLIILFTTVQTEEWFMPDSHLISPQQFTDKILNDGSTYKLVKFFTPHCTYCRYLKTVIDKLKHEKQWCFQIYDFNCQWYPQFCQTSIKTSSFPYTVFYSPDGSLNQDIHGFYPEPVLRPIFDKMQQKCLDSKQRKNTIIDVKKIQQKQNSQIIKVKENQQQIVVVDEAIKIQQKQNNQINTGKENHQQIVVVNEAIKIQSKQVINQNKKDNSQKEQQSISNNKQVPQTFASLYHYIFCIICTIIGAFYFKQIYSKHTSTKSDLNNHQMHKNNQNTSNPQRSQSKQMNKQQLAVLLDKLPDDQL